MKRKTQRKQSKQKLRLQATAATPLPIPVREMRVPKRWVKFIIALFLLPMAWVMTHAFLILLANTAIHDRFWLSEELWFFAIGILAWPIAYFGLPPLIWVYVFGHELTHALVIWMTGGSISSFHIGKDGGYVVSDRVNTWIALSPYFVPLYSVLAVVLFGLCGLFFDVWFFHKYLYFVIGFTWAFHFTFTCVMIPKGQPDLAYGGSLFSLTVIYIMNLLVLALLLIIVNPQVTWYGFAKEVVRSGITFMHQVQALIAMLPS